METIRRFAYLIHYFVSIDAISIILFINSNCFHISILTILNTYPYYLSLFIIIIAITKLFIIMVNEV